MSNEARENTREIKELLTELIRIDSANAFLIEGAAGSAQVQRFIRDYLSALNVETELQQVDESHSNVKATIPGTGGGRALTLYAHTDTVGYALWPEKALVAEESGDKLIGLGSADDKGHCAAMLLLAKKNCRGGAEVKGRCASVLYRR